jgi:hypothetical protein
MLSDDDNNHIYGLKNQTFYIKPFKERKFNKHHYIKLSGLNSPSSGKGMENTDFWVHADEITGKYTLEIVKNNQVIAQVDQKPYFVKQKPGSNLGYDIVNFDARLFPDANPTFYAYKFKVPDTFGEYRLRLVNHKGAIVKTSIRKVYPLRKPSLAVLLVIASLPLLGMMMNLIRKIKGALSKIHQDSFD